MPPCCSKCRQYGLNDKNCNAESGPALAQVWKVKSFQPTTSGNEYEESSTRLAVLDKIDVVSAVENLLKTYCSFHCNLLYWNCAMDENATVSVADKYTTDFTATPSTGTTEMDNTSPVYVVKTVDISIVIPSAGVVVSGESTTISIVVENNAETKAIETVEDSNDKEFPTLQASVLKKKKGRGRPAKEGKKPSSSQNTTGVKLI
ncbi:hypothetical protein V6N13_025278 [Hibiscus sabdariffa]